MKYCSRDRTRFLKSLMAAAALLVISASATPAQRTKPLIIDHNCIDITRIPESAINQAKTDLHIAFGHTSHGGQLTTGMTGLVSFANAGGLGLAHPLNLFQWNWGGTGGALDLRDEALNGDLDYYPDWENETRGYLGPPDTLTGRGTTNPEINVIIWAWCWTVSMKYENNLLDSEYFTPMSQLELDYPGVTFVYMTGHVDHTKSYIKQGNQAIRDFCAANNKVLYDFADIESYDPDGTYFEFVHDNCDYYVSAAANDPIGNWALEWQGAHNENVDWYDCQSDHSQPLNANLKAYTAWWLWASLAGWADPTGTSGSGSPAAGASLAQNFPNPFNPVTTIRYELPAESWVDLKIYNIRGDEVASLAGGTQPAGPRQVTWDGRDNAGNPVSSGVYLYRLRAAGFDQTRKMVLIR